MPCLKEITDSVFSCHLEIILKGIEFLIFYLSNQGRKWDFILYIFQLSRAKLFQVEKTNPHQDE